MSNIKTADHNCYRKYPQDIPINGEGVSSLHCFLTNDGSCVTLTPFHTTRASNANSDEDDAVIDGFCGVDGVRITETTQLMQENLIRLGKSTCFRFHDISLDAGYLSRKCFRAFIGLRAPT